MDTCLLSLAAITRTYQSITNLIQWVCKLAQFSQQLWLTIIILQPIMAKHCRIYYCAIARLASALFPQWHSIKRLARKYGRSRLLDSGHSNYAFSRGNVLSGVKGVTDTIVGAVDNSAFIDEIE